ncbi:MAG TPA: cytochrome c family protein [Xanthobacteraceae bacterium]|jgi:cytochrome c
MKTTVMAIVALAALTGPALAQDPAAGEQVFKRLCSPCHDIGPQAKIKLGPPLNGIDGRKAGTFEGYGYSQANKSSGITWNEQSFTSYIHAPMQAVPGTKMTFVGIKNDKDIADLWAYLKQFGPDGQKK